MRFPIDPGISDRYGAVCMGYGEVRPTVAVVGLGYVGLPTALAFAEAGYAVAGYDVSEEALAAIKAGRVDLVAPDQDRLTQHVGSERLVLTTDPCCLDVAEAVLVCVPTPVDEHFTPDLGALSAACETVVVHACANQLIVQTSTSYAGSTRKLLVEPLAERGFRVGEDVFVAFSPERIDPGNVKFPQSLVPRVVGGVGAACQARAEALLGQVASGMHAVSSPETAEMTKLLENSFRAVNIALVNEFADVCGQFGLDVREVIEGAATKPFGFMPFYPGPGVGGHCIPCDSHYLLWQLRTRRARLPVTEAGMWSIAGRPHRVVDRARQILADQGRSSSAARVLVVGVAYKPGISDVRQSPALEIINELDTEGTEVALVDPHVEQLLVNGRELQRLSDPTAGDWDLVVLHTLHPGVDHSWLGTAPVVLDTTYRARELPNRVML